jgi:heptaprenyl diphosphate synthase
MVYYRNRFCLVGDKLVNKFPNDIFGIVRDDLATVEKALYSTIQSPVNLVNDIGGHLVQAGGKRLRPALYLLCAKGGDPSQSEMIPMAVALELIHMATLVHDDVIDNASTRRGFPTANSRWGNHSSVLTGDYLWARAFSSIATVAKHNMLKILTDVIAGMCEGEIVQMQEAFNPNRDEADYRLRVAQKTADFIAASCELGALSGGLNDRDVAQVREYGYAIGMAFQITDDILDVVGDEKKLGKPIGSDVKNKKATYPSLVGLENSRVLAREAVARAVQSLNIFDSSADVLRYLASRIIDRET